MFENWYRETQLFFCIVHRESTSTFKREFLFSCFLGEKRCGGEVLSGVFLHGTIFGMNMSTAHFCSAINRVIVFFSLLGILL